MPGCWVFAGMLGLPCFLGHKCLQLFLHGMQGGTTAAGKNLKPNIATTTATSRQAALPISFSHPSISLSLSLSVGPVVFAMSATFTTNRLL